VRPDEPLATASYVLGQALVEGCEVAAMHASQLCQVGISYLPVADDALGWHAGVLDVIGPELVSLVAGRAGQDGPCRGGGLALPGEQALPWVIGQVAKPSLSVVNQSSAGPWWTWSSTSRAMSRFASRRTLTGLRPQGAGRPRR